MIVVPEITAITLKYNNLKYLCLIPALIIIIFKEIVAICHNNRYDISKKVNLENTDIRIHSKKMKKHSETVKKKKI